MVIDTSALLAILFDEPAAPEIESAISEDSIRLVSAGSALEAAIVVEARFGEYGGRELDLLFHKAQFEVVSFDIEQMACARTAYRRYGKGRSPASLNFGDCFAYALAVTSGEPLLFIGDDFARTDVNAVL